MSQKPYKNLAVCIDSHIPSKIRQLKILQEDKVSEVKKINNQYYSVFNILYLTNKYKDIVCSIKNLINPNSSDISHIFNNLNIKILFNLDYACIECKKLPIPNQNAIIIYNERLEPYIKNCIENKKFIVLDVFLEYKNSAHANTLIYNPNFNEVKIFEPYGTNKYNSIFKAFVKVIFPKDVQYVNQDYLKAFQTEHLEEYATEEGHCATWSIWYPDQRLKYPELNAQNALKIIYNKAKKDYKDDFQKLVKTYVEFVRSQREYVLNNVETYPIVIDLLKKYWDMEDPIEPTPEKFKNRISLSFSIPKSKIPALVPR